MRGMHKDENVDILVNTKSAPDDAETAGCSF